MDFKFAQNASSVPINQRCAVSSRYSILLHFISCAAQGSEALHKRAKIMVQNVLYSDPGLTWRVSDQRGQGKSINFSKWRGQNTQRCRTKPHVTATFPVRFRASPSNSWRGCANRKQYLLQRYFFNDFFLNSDKINISTPFPQFGHSCLLKIIFEC